MTEPSNAGQLVNETCIEIGQGVKVGAGFVPPPLPQAAKDALAVLVPLPINADPQSLKR